MSQGCRIFALGAASPLSLCLSRKTLQDTQPQSHPATIHISIYKFESAPMLFPVRRILLIIQFRPHSRLKHATARNT